MWEVTTTIFVVFNGLHMIPMTIFCVNRIESTPLDSYRLKNLAELNCIEQILYEKPTPKKNWSRLIYSIDNILKVFHFKVEFKLKYCLEIVFVKKISMQNITNYCFDKTQKEKKKEEEEIKKMLLQQHKIKWQQQQNTGSCFTATQKITPKSQDQLLYSFISSFSYCFYNCP